MSGEHTQTPWELVPADDHHGPYVTSPWGSDICDCYAMSNPNCLSVRNGGTSYPIHFVDADANAEFIVRAVNSFEDLVSALKTIAAQHALFVGLDDDIANATKEVVRSALLKAGAL